MANVISVIAFEYLTYFYLLLYDVLLELLE